MTRAAFAVGYLCRDLDLRQRQIIAGCRRCDRDQAYATEVPCYLSPITAWEVGQLVSRRRLQLLITPERWFARMCETAGVSLAGLSPNILIASSFLPGRPPRDPADRIVIATARDLAATIVTRDRALLAYGEQGHVGVLEC